MPRRPSLPRALEDLIAKLEPELANAFLDAIQSMRDGVDMQALIEALERGDIEAAIKALDITPADFNRYTIERMSAFAAAGELEAAYIPTREAESVRFVFDMQNPRAERWIREQAAERITGYVAEQVETAREVIADGYSKGAGPQQIALDIAGRINPASGKREGGIIGLSGPQAGYVKSMRERLASGDPAEMLKVLGRFGKDGKWVEGTGMTLRDRRYDGVIKRAIVQAQAQRKYEAAVAEAEAAGLPAPKPPKAKKVELTPAKIDELAGLYADRLLKRRAEDVARTETQQGVFGARMESYRQALEREGLPGEACTKTFRHQGAGDDSRVQHIIMHNKTVDGIDTPFIMPDGTLMQYAHDPAGGAKHNIGCRCNTDFRIMFGYRSD